MANPIVPRSNQDMINFFKAHLPAWTANAGAINLSIDNITQINDLIGVAEDEFESAELIRTQSLTQTQTMNLALQNLRSYGSDLVKSIRTYAETQNDPSIYDLAQLPAPATPEELKATPAPTGVISSLNPDGTISLSWKVPSKGAFAGKTFFIIERKLTGSFTGAADSDWVSYATSNDRAHTDETVPGGWSTVSYRIRTNRNGFLSKSSTVAEVNFGNSGANATSAGGETIAEAA